MLLLWISAAALEFLIWLGASIPFHLTMALFSLAFAVLIFRGYRWVFWINLGLLSLMLGVAILQLQIPSWANGAPPLAVWGRAIITVGMMLLHQLSSVQGWFGIQGRGRRWQTVFWLVTASLTMLGQYVLPTLKAFSR